MLVTKCISDNYKVLVTVLAIMVVNIHYCFTLAPGTNIEILPPTSKNLHQREVTNITTTGIGGLYSYIRYVFDYNSRPCPGVHVPESVSRSPCPGDNIRPIPVEPIFHLNHSWDYRVKETEECKVKTIPNQCTRIYMVTDYDHKCPYGDDRFIGMTHTLKFIKWQKS